MPTNVEWRLDRLQDTVDDDHKLLDETDGLARKHENELHGERGIYRALDDLTHQMMWVNRGLWAIALAIIGTAFGIIFGGHP